MFITKMLDETTDKDVYYQYRKLYNSLLVVEDSQSLYLDRQGNPQTTYADLLKNTNGALFAEYERIIDIETGIDNALNAIFARLASYADYIFLANVNRITSMFDIVMRLIRFFKSYTVDFVNSGIRYIFDDRYLQAMKLMDTLDVSGTSISIKDIAFNNNRYYKDVMEQILTKLSTKDKMLLKDIIGIGDTVYIYDKEHTKFIDKLLLDFSSIELRDSYQFYDDIHGISKELDLHSGLKLRDSLQIETSYAE